MLEEMFKPMKGCEESCPIRKKEKEKGGEVCCDASRQCCFYCLEENCPILEAHEQIIAKMRIAHGK